MGLSYDVSAARNGARESRLKVFQPIQIETVAGTMRAHLLNLSCTGALIHCAEIPGRGSVVRVELSGTIHFARVMWCDGKRFGVAFMAKLAAAQIEEALAVQNDLITRAVARAA